MTKYKLEFMGHDNMPKASANKGDVIPEGMLGKILEHVVTAPKGKAAVFRCEDRLHAGKVAFRLHYLLGSGYVFAAHNHYVYAKRIES